MISSTELLLASSIPRMGWMSIRIAARFFTTIATILLCLFLPLELIFNYIGIQISASLDAGHVAWHYNIAARLSLGVVLGVVFSAVLAWIVGLLIEGEIPTFRNTLALLLKRRVFQVLGTLTCSTALTFLPLLLVLLPIYFAPHLVVRVLDLGAFVALAVAVVVCFCLNVVLSLTPFVAVFEGSFYRQAINRSISLAKGRVLWLTAALGFGGLFFVALTLAVGYVPTAMFDLGDDFTFATFSGVLEQLAISFFSNVVMAWFAIFQALVYFRIRRDKHDLTFFNVGPKTGFQPAAELLGHHD